MTADRGVTNVLIAGVGGQGILLASDILSQCALIAGLDVKKSEVHGMSQRGGAVNSHVRFGQKVYSPLIPEGQVRLLAAFEKLEALRWEHALAEGGRLVVNDLRLDPATVTSGGLRYPEDALERLRAAHGAHLTVVDGPGLSLAAGDLRTMNTVVLGALSNFLDFNLDNWRQAMQETIASAYLDLNIRAFELGRQAVQTPAEDTR